MWLDARLGESEAEAADGDVAWVCRVGLGGGAVDRAGGVISDESADDAVAAGQDGLGVDQSLPGADVGAGWRAGGDLVAAGGVGVGGKNREM